MNAIHWSSAERVMLLPARLGIAEAADMHRVASAALLESPTLQVDASHVDEIDTAALQLLANLWLACQSAGGRCDWRGPVPPSVRKASRLIGLYGLLHFPSQEKA